MKKPSDINLLSFSFFLVIRQKLRDSRVSKRDRGRQKGRLKRRRSYSLYWPRKTSSKRNRERMCALIGINLCSVFSKCFTINEFETMHKHKWVGLV